MKARNALTNSGSFFASSICLISFCIFLLNTGIFLFIPLITQSLYLNFTAKSAQSPILKYYQGICELFD